MKTFTLPIIALALIALSSCSTAYKTGQTPDDVYYSPVKPKAEYVVAEKDDDRMYQGSDDYYEDRYLRMRVANRSLWSPLDDYYMSSPYGYNYYSYSSPWSSFNSPWNNYWSWNYYYNPYNSFNYGHYGGYYGGYYGGGYGGYYGGVAVGHGYSRPPISRPVAFNPASYGRSNMNNQRTRVNNTNNGYGRSTYQGYNNNNNGRTSSYRGNTSNTRSNSYSNDNSTPTRSYTPSSSSSSGSRSSSGGSGGGGISRPGRN